MSSHPQHPSPDHAHPLAKLSLFALLSFLLLGLLSTPALAAPLAKTPLRAIERYAPYQPQSTCSPTAKAGTVAFRTLLLRAYGGTGDYGIIRNCAQGGRSEHKEGRAWDWAASATKPAQVRQVNDMLTWLFATDKYGNTHAQARRLGVMYVIWNHRIWNAGSHTWTAYKGSDPHTSHVHFSLSWAGALKKTSYWTNVVSGVIPAPGTKPAPKPAPKPVPKPAPKPVPKPDPSFTVAADDADGVTTSYQLVAGRKYLLMVKGTYRYGPDAMLADAECSVHPDDGQWSRHSQWEGDGSNRGHLDLEVQGESTRWMTADRTPCATATHAYGTVIVPRTSGPLVLKVVDDLYSDNSGSLTVTVKAISA